MIRRIAVLLGLGALTLLAISVIVFGATQALPGDITVQLLGVQATPRPPSSSSSSSASTAPSSCSTSPGSWACCRATSALPSPISCPWPS
ncbi:hypothetical protein [Leucobacter soli]|uniref:hypothetical protein n=1 Tax=Leucobacter soli TaxID=2812850 RepID=UPI00362369E7